jgi:hypothetical protein
LLTTNEAHRDERYDKRNATWARLANTWICSPEEYRDLLEADGCCVTEIDVRPEKHWITLVAKPDV